MDGSRSFCYFGLIPEFGIILFGVLQLPFPQQHSERYKQSEWKHEYIQIFNAMESFIKERQSSE